MNFWILFGFVIVIEVIGLNCIKVSNGFIKLFLMVIVIGVFVVVLYLLFIIIKIFLFGIVYVVWFGVGIVFIILVVMFFFG